MSKESIALPPIPVSWQWARLIDISYKFESGSRPKGGVRGIQEGIPSIGGEHINTVGTFDFTEIKFIPANFYQNIKRGSLTFGDILIVKDGATTGKTAIVRDNFPFKEAAVNEHVFLIRLQESMSNLFVFYYLVSPVGQNYVQQNLHGTAQGGITHSFSEETYVPIPPLQEQSRIVNRLEELFTKLDAGVEELHKVKAQLKRYRQAVLKAAFEGKLTAEWRKAHQRELESSSVLLDKISDERKKSGKYKKSPPINNSELPELPDGWAWVTIESISKKVTDGTHFTPTYLQDGVPFISVKDIRGGQVHFDDCKYISREEHERLIKRCHPECEDVLITKSGTIGRVAVVNDETEFSLFVSVALIKIFKSTLVSRYIASALENYIKGIDINQVIKGGLIKNLHIEDLKVIAVPFTNGVEQNKIVEEIDRYLSIADELDKTIVAGLKEAERMRQSILKSAFEGNLVPQDLGDEPAANLLERIRAARNKEGTKGRLTHGK